MKEDTTHNKELKTKLTVHLANNDLQNIHIKLKNPLKPGREFRYSGRISSSCTTSGIRRVNLATNPVMRKGLESVYHSEAVIL